ncbi:hepatocyte growth factor-regulated tyrosine kinase substrate isoform X2 [Aplysia californica]|uniref:Hepatocyte growth factor-regulated tyrosine kinase substrate n=1 Tax=Aplysia californica TaxID=6500 RepID=A0ABM1A5Q8_APLCA|nr:hepatocyte growth factor-regulated tyrosine kinase substrate isoform X2 [Aplysia californica]
MFSSSSSNFNRNLEKATSQLLLEPDWDSVLQIVDCIRQGDVQPKFAVQSIRKKISVENPHVAQFALLVVEACVKNCGSTFHNEVATKEFMEFLKDQVKKVSTDPVRGDPVKEKILELVQTWSNAFRNEPKYKAVEDTFHLLKMEGHKFPALKEADAMFDAERAPQWKEGETCTRCRVKFGVVQRQHHCRNCGEVFCGKCSSKTTTIPKLGFEREVRVCDSCYDKINKAAASGKKEDDLPAEYLASPLSKQSQAPPSKSEQEQQEEEELQLALALSKSEHETKEKERERLRSNYGVYGGGNNNRAPSPAKVTPAPAPITAIDTSDMDPELARYLNRHYWQQKSDEQQQQPMVSTTVPSAPAPNSEPRVSTSAGHVNEAPQVVSSHLYQNGDTDNEQEQFLSALQGSLEIFVNRMRSNSQRGRPIANDSAVQSLFAVISEMHPQLMTHIQEREDTRSYYEGLQDKLTQLRDAREALDSLREEHREKRRREAEELERQRQIQMMQKLEVMRQKKHEYLEMQRQLALQRLQEQEREMHARMEQQKHLTHIRQMQAFGYAQGYPQQMMGQPGVPPQGMGPPPGMPAHSYVPGGGGSAEGSPVHRMTPGPDGYGGMQVMNQGAGMVMPPQSGMYNMGAQPPMGNQYAPPASLPAGGYQPDAQGMVAPQGYSAQDQGAVSLPPQHAMTGPMTTAPPNNMGVYGTLPSQMSTAGMPGGHPPMGGIDSQGGFGSMPAQSSDFQSFNMQGLSTALPPHQGPQPMYNNQPMQQPPQQYANTAPPPGQPQQFQQQPQQFVGQYQQSGAAPGQPSQLHQAEQKEAQLISFDD